MNTTLRIVLAVIGALAIALLVGWFWGSSGRSTLRTDLGATTLELDLARARADILQARVDIFEVNFGNASRRLEEAKASLQAAIDRLARANAGEASARVKDALASVERAQKMAGNLDQGANSAAREAVSALDAAVGAVRVDR
jgi:hypothetical protein